MSADERGAPAFDAEDERTARAVWSRIAEPGDHPAQDLVARLGPCAALGEVMAGRAAPRWRVRLAGADPARDIRTVTRLGGRLVIPGDDEWPSCLDDLGEEAPFCLWIRGTGSLPEGARSVAVVGARAASGYGTRLAEQLAQGCAERGFPVVSGAAFGVDAAAHRGCLRAGGRTVAVLACGVDRYYPLGHESLIRRVAATGVVLSEVPPGSSPTRWRFVERNRLIAALARVVVVVEASARSGSLGTAARGQAIGRDVAAYPGSVLSDLSLGTNRLLRNGAHCVTGIDDVAELVGAVGEFLPAETDVPARELDGLAGADLRVAEALPVRAAAGIESLCLVAGLEEAAVAAALGRLELRGLALREEGGWRRPASPRERSNDTKVRPDGA